MVKLDSPLFSFGASGSMGKSGKSGGITFSKWKGVSYGKKRPIPHNPKSPGQTGIRSNFSGVVAAYKILTAPDKTLWVTEGSMSEITGMNAMMRTAQHNLENLGGIQMLPTTITTAPPDAPTAPAASVSGKQVMITWTPSITANAYQTYLYMSSDTAFVPGPTNLVKVVPQVDDAAQIIPGPGTWYFYLKCDSEDGILSTESTKVTAVVA